MKNTPLQNMDSDVRIAVISDTHNLLRPEISDKAKTCDLILHAGDIARPQTLSALEEIAPVYAVCGNADRELAQILPKEREFEISGFRFYMIHNKKQMRTDLTGIDFVIFGHSHKYEVTAENGRTCLNPGSCGPRRFRQPVTMLTLTLCPQTHAFHIEKTDLTPADMRRKEPQPFPEKEMDRLIRRIIKEMNAGKTVSEIARKNQIDPELAGQICRIYATHPGVDVDGILNRMEIKDL